VNLKLCKKLRKLARSMAGVEETNYAVIERRVMKFIDGEQRNFIKLQIIVHPACIRGTYRSLKKGLRTEHIDSGWRS
jgi:hypothetical protein